MFLMINSIKRVGTIVEEKQMKRKEHLDIAKGIGILLVVLGHCPLIYNPFKQWIYSFHMPLFFIISGMVWDKSSHEHKGFFTRKFLFDKIKRLIIPCCIWGVLYTLISAIMNRSFSLRYVAYLLYGSQSTFRRAESLTSLWFLPCMFLAICAFEIIQQVLMGSKHRSLALLCISAVFASIGLFLPHFSIGYPWSADVAFLAVSYMIWGYLTADHFESLTDKKSGRTFLFLLLSLLLSLTFILNLSHASFNNVDLAGRQFGNGALYLINAVSGSSFVLLLAILLCKARPIAEFLSYLGRNTMPIFILHKPMVRLFNSLGSKVGLPAMITVIISVIIATGVSLFVHLLTKRILPIAFGESHRRRTEPELLT